MRECTGLLAGVLLAAGCGLADEGGSQSDPELTGLFGIGDEKVGQTFAPPVNTYKCFREQNRECGHGECFRDRECASGQLCVAAAPNDKQQVRGKCVDAGTLEAGEACSEYATGRPTGTACASGRCEEVPDVSYWHIEEYNVYSHDRFANNRIDPYSECVAEPTSPPRWVPPSNNVLDLRATGPLSQVEGCENCNLTTHYCRMNLDPRKLAQLDPRQRSTHDRYQPECVSRLTVERDSDYSPTGLYCDGYHALQTAQHNSCQVWQWCQRGRGWEAEEMRLTTLHGNGENALQHFARYGVETTCATGTSKTGGEPAAARKPVLYCSRKKAWQPQGFERALQAAQERTKPSIWSTYNFGNFHGCSKGSTWCSAGFDSLRRTAGEGVQIDLERAPGWSRVYITTNGESTREQIRALEKAFDLNKGPCPSEKAPVARSSSSWEPFSDS